MVSLKSLLNQKKEDEFNKYLLSNDRNNQEDEN